MSEKRWDQLRSGVIGHFTPIVDPAVDWSPGMLRLDDDRAAVVFRPADGLMERELYPPDCDAVAADTECGTALLALITRRSGGISGFPRAAYESSALLLDVDFDDVDGDTAVGASLTYGGLYEWCGDRVITNEPIDVDGQTVGWRAEIRPPTPQRVPLDDGFTLKLSVPSRWAHRHDRLTFHAPLVATVESTERRSLEEHIQRLDAIHALLSVVHRDTVSASEGAAKLADDSDWLPMWERTYVSTSAENPVHEFPHLGIEQVGGIEGIAAWVRLVLDHRRAVAPIVRHALFDNQTPESRMFSTAAAIEYWVAVHRRTDVDWAVKSNSDPFPWGLANFVHSSWHTWVGDAQRWIDTFWQIYNDLKHAPDKHWDGSVVNAFEISGRWLLTAALLDTCASSSGPSEHIFTKRLGREGHHLRDLLKEVPE